MYRYFQTMNLYSYFLIEISFIQKNRPTQSILQYAYIFTQTPQEKRPLIHKTILLLQLSRQEINKQTQISSVTATINTKKPNRVYIKFVQMLSQAHVMTLLVLLIVVSQCDKPPKIEEKAAYQIAKKVPPIKWPPIDLKCCNTHNIYAVDTSGSMWGLSWSKALAYLTSVSGSSDYTSLFTHGGTWSGPPFQVTNYLDHVLNAAIPPALPSPYGDTDYDDALIRAIEILNQGYPERTCITFISDGWEEVYNLPVANVIEQFKQARKKFQSKTGCRVCVKCYQTQKFTQVTNFDKFCEEIGARVTVLKTILDADVPKYKEFEIRAKKFKDPKDNGPRTIEAKDPK